MRQSYFFWAILVITMYWVVQLYKPFIMNLVIAALLCIATFNIKIYLDKFISSNLMTSLISTASILAIAILPAIMVGNNIMDEISKIDINELNKFVIQIKQQSIGIVNKLPIYIKNNIIDNIQSLDTQLLISHALNIGKKIGGIGIKFITDITLISIFMYLFFYYGETLKKYIVDIIPLEKNNSQWIMKEVGGVIKIVMLSTIASMILQGISFGIVASIFGLSGILFGTMYAIASIIPVVGGSIVWIPIGLYIYWIGDTKGAIFIAIYSMIFIGIVIDNVVKPIIINLANKIMLDTPITINEMIIFISILAGIASFGFWGVMIGPAMSAFFIALLRTYQNSIKHYD